MKFHIQNYGYPLVWHSQHTTLAAHSHLLLMIIHSVDWRNNHADNANVKGILSAAKCITLNCSSSWAIIRIIINLLEPKCL